jgi:branched-chain amino acid transport system ATP-binding protein
MSGSGDRALSGPGGRALALKDVCVSFGGNPALTDVSLTVDTGEVLGLIGPNGAGKTTLFDVISGVRVPGRGRVFLGGRDVTKANAVRRARWGMRRTFQRVQTFGWLTVEDNVLSALEWEGGGGGFTADLFALPTRRRHEKSRRARVAEMIDQCGLGAVRTEPAGSLPIGLARMVEVARALIADPKVLLLDEPSSGLDHGEAAYLAESIQRVKARGDCAVIVVEHDVGFVMGQSDRVMVLNLGQVLAIGTPAEVQDNPEVRAAYLGDVETGDVETDDDSAPPTASSQTGVG